MADIYFKDSVTWHKRRNPNDLGTPQDETDVTQACLIMESVRPMLDYKGREVVSVGKIILPQDAEPQSQDTFTVNGVERTIALITKRGTFDRHFWQVRIV